MSGFQRFVTYINLYEENSKIRNAGFARIEKREEQCKIEIHMRGTGFTGITCPAYLYVREEEKMRGIQIGNLQLTNGAGDGRFLLDGNNINQSGFRLEQIGGFLIFITDRVMLASQWDDKEIRREQFSPMEEMPKQQEVPEEKKEPEEKVEAAQAPQEEDNTLKATEAAPQLQPRITPVNRPNPGTGGKGHPQAGKEEQPWPQKWQFILENYPVMTPFEGEEEIQCVRIELKDLRMLPKRYWYLGNNSFLLHGFFNYRYLILGAMTVEDKKRWFIGVPGIFQSQEKVMAAIFGFTEYKSEKKSEHKTEQFGYWYRFMDE